MNSILRRRRAIMGVKKEEGIPDEYQEVTYIAITSLGADKFVKTVQIPQLYPTILEGRFYEQSYGAYNGYSLQLGQYNQNPTIAMNLRNSAVLARNGGNFGATVTVTVQNKIADVKLSINENEFVNEVKVSNNSYSATWTQTPVSWSGKDLIVGYHNGNGQMFGRTYFVRVTQRGKVIVDLKPCYRKSDAKIGMYDLVLRTFFPATGEWTKGADVT